MKYEDVNGNAKDGRTVQHEIIPCKTDKTRLRNVEEPRDDMLTVK